MTRWRKGVVCSLALLLPASAWAGTASPCTRDAGSAHHSQMTANAHAHHGAPDSADTGSGAHLPDSHAPHLSDVDCPCCDDCAEACGLSGCNLIAIVAGAGPGIPDAAGAVAADDDAFRIGPVCRRLLRPPIVLS